jgi:ATP-dependent RNA helicase DeaD
MHPFRELSVHPSLLAALEARGYETATPVQASVLASECDERDLLVSAKTGSGKTVAFGIALAKTLLGESPRFAPAADPVVLVVAPTRELASQVARELTWLYQPAGGRVTTCLGGMDFGQERRALDSGPHIVVGTPGRLCDHLDRGTLRLSKLSAVVLDEADEMLDMGFRDDLETLLGAAPQERRTLLFSATFPAGIASLAKSYQRDAVRVQATDPEEAHSDITYRAHLVSYREREHAVVNILRAHEGVTAIVFVATRDGVAHLHSNLVERGFNAVPLSGELSQNERTRALKAVRDGRANVLVATDVAARGLDLPHLGLVIHADLPNDGAVLQHRSGRTGRAGKKGISALLVPPAKRRAAERMLREASVDPEWAPIPTAEQIARLDEEKILQDASERAGALGDFDRELGAKLLEKLGAEAVSGLLAATERGKRPVAEELAESSALYARVDAEPRREAREPMKGGAWFRMNVGHAHQADPRWIVPILCRRGQIEKKHIGAIRIFTNETKIEIAAEVADAFDKAVRAPDRKDPSIRIVACDPPGRTTRPRGEEPTPKAGRFERSILEESSPWDRDRRPSPDRGRPSGPPRGDGPDAPRGPRFGKKPFGAPREGAGGFGAPREGAGGFRGPRDEGAGGFRSGPREEGAGGFRSGPPRFDGPPRGPKGPRGPGRRG